MAANDSEEELLRTVALRNAQSILQARQRAEEAARAAHEALRASEDRFRAIFSQAAVGIAVAQLDGRWVQANQKFADLMGMTIEELTRRTVTDITHPDDVPVTQELGQRLVSGEIAHYVLEKRYLRADGASVWANTTVTLLRDAENRPLHFIGIVDDISERKAAETALREETRILEVLNATAPSIASQLDLQTLLQTVTDAATALSGARYGAFFYTHRDASGDAFALYTLSGAPREAFSRLGHPRATTLLGPTLRGESLVRSDDVLRDPRYGKWSPHHGMPHEHPPVRSFLAVPVNSRSGEVLGSIFLGHPDPGVFTERTERLIVGLAAQTSIAIDNARLYDAAQREIENRERAELALREIDRRKDEFLATLAHELRNPLAPIRQAALISQATAATEAQKRWSHEVIARQVNHMSLLLDDLLDISRITRGTLELRKKRTELASIIDAAVETARPVIDAKRHTLIVQVPPEPVYFEADSLRLAQVLSNLLTNAAKYTDPEGRIQLEVVLMDDEIVFTVTDNGIGISADALPDVFRMFSQVKSHNDRSDGGLGIGLALAKGLVTLHGGHIEARSDGLGRGSEFIVRIPLGAPLEHATDGGHARSQATQPARRRVLIADDNRDAAESLAILLQMDGHDVSIAQDGAEALAMFARQRPDAVVLDIGMPGLNGYEVARRMRRQTNGTPLLLIAATGWGQPADKALAFAAGFDHHFTKPLEPAAISRLLHA